MYIIMDTLKEVNASGCKIELLASDGRYIVSTNDRALWPWFLAVLIAAALVLGVAFVALSHGG
jgi:hypothetical protein